MEKGLWSCYNNIEYNEFKYAKGKLLMKDNGKKNIMHVFLLYGVFAFYIVLLLAILFRTTHPTRSANLTPFYTINCFLSVYFSPYGKQNIIVHAFALSNLLGNIVIFIPLGVYITLFNKNKGIGPNILWILAATVAVEIIQYTFRLGIGDIDDVILNCIGGFFGIFICKSLYFVFKDDFKVRRIVGIAAPLIGIMSITGLILYNRY